MPQSASQVIIMLILVGVIGPVCEELIYRHWLLVPLRKYGDFQAVVITSLLFGFFHGNLTQFLYTAAGGFIYGIVAVRANSVKPAIILHIINNCYFVLYSRLNDAAGVTGNPALISFSDILPWLMIAMGFVCLVALCCMRRFSIENSNPHMTAAERVRMIAANPLIWVMTIALVADTIRGI
jgi:uncharacterized membrane protein YeaQ/YmgE (transglycosylase-associated protein family)